MTWIYFCVAITALCAGILIGAHFEAAYWKRLIAKSKDLDEFFAALQGKLK